MAEIANILFDFGNVIIDIDIPGATQRIGSLRNPDIEESKYSDYVHDLVRKYEVNAISTDGFINGVLRYAHNKVQARDVILAWNSMIIGIPEYRLEMLDQLRRNHNLYLLSNTNELHIEQVHHHLQRSHAIEDFESRYFDEVYYSHEIGERKPDDTCFRHVIENALITPRKTLFIDDTKANIEAALEMGFQVLHSPEEEEIAETLKLQGLY